MEKVQTLARRAEDQVISELLRERGIVKPWSLASYDMQAITLQTTLDELPLLFFNPAHLRPGYKVDEKTVRLPGLFVKLSGTDKGFSVFNDISSLEKRGNCFSVSSFSKFNPDATDEGSMGECLTPDFRVNRERLLSLGQIAVRQLRLEYQQLFMDKMDEILIHREEYLLLSTKALSCEKILLSMLSLDHAYIEAWNNFDFQYLPPALVLHNEERESLSTSQAVQLLLLRLLGFDIIIVSKIGVSDLENVIHNDVYNIYYGEKQAAVAKKRSFNKKFIPIAILAVILVGLAAALFILFGNGSPGLKSIVSGVNKVWDTYPGALNTNDKWSAVVSADNLANNVFAAARKYGSGRIMALGKDDILTNDFVNQMDNLKFLENTMNWLNGSGKKKVGYSSGHGEFINSESIAVLKNELEKEGFVIGQIPITDAMLERLDVLIVGNAWKDLTNDEISVVKEFVNNGGGLLLPGNGWSFRDYHPGETYPMDVLSSDFGVAWDTIVISDTMEKYLDAPVFTVFYPDGPPSK